MSGNGLIVTFQLSSAAFLNLGWSQNGVQGNALKSWSANALSLDQFMT